MAIFSYVYESSWHLYIYTLTLKHKLQDQENSIQISGWIKIGNINKLCGLDWDFWLVYVPQPCITSDIYIQSRSQYGQQNQNT